MSDDISIPTPSYRAPRGGGARIDASTLRLAKIAGGILACVAVVAVAGSFVGRHGGEVPVIQADNRPIRVKPDNPGGMQIAGTHDDIFSGDNGADGSKLAPPPESPDPKLLSAQPVSLPPSVTSPPSSAQVNATPAPVKSHVTAPVAQPPGKPISQAALPMAKPASPATALTAKPLTSPAHQATPSKGATIQLAALASESAAKTEWHVLQKRMPSLLAGHQPVFSKTEHDGKIFWRLRASGFTDVAQARATCDKVRAKGNACSVAEL